MLQTLSLAYPKKSPFLIRIPLMTRCSPSAWWPRSSKELGASPRLGPKKRMMIGMAIQMLSSIWFGHCHVTPSGATRGKIC